MADTETYVAAGRRLRALREAKQYTQQDIERESGHRHGQEGRVYAQQVSRIEKGTFDKPPIVDLLRLGEVLGLQPDDIAEMYELWERQDRSDLDPRIREALDLAARLPLDLKEELLHNIEFATSMAKAKARARLQENNGATVGER